MKGIFLLLLNITFFTNIVFGSTLFYTQERTTNHYGLSLVKEMFSIKLGVDLRNFHKLKHFQIQLPFGADISINKIRGHFKNGYYFFEGKVEHDPFGRVSLVLKNELLSGEIISGGHSYTLFKKDQNLFLVETYQQGDEKLNGDDFIELPKNHFSPQTIVTTKSTDRFIDILMVYTDDVKTAHPNVEADLTSYIASVNRILEKSCVNFQYRITHMEEVTYTETADMSIDLPRIKDGTAPFNGIAALRDTHGADLVHLIVNTSTSSCGLGYLNAGPNFDDSAGYAMTNYACGVNTLAHELGHNLGLHHDRYERDLGLREASSTYKTGFGFSDLVNKNRSIMAYADHCTAVSLSCPRIEAFSNPRLMYSAVRFGLKGYINSAKVLNANFPYIANFRTAKSAFSPTIKNFCLGKEGETKDEEDLHCFIATAVKGSYMDSDVLKLRKFRDRFLKTNFLGRKVIEVYYKFSPTTAHKIEHNESLKKIIRPIVEIFAFFAHHFLIFLYSIIILSVVFSFFLIKKMKSFVKVSIVFFSLSLVSDGEASVSYPSYLKKDFGMNPSTRLLVTSHIFASAGFKINNHKIESIDKNYKEKDKKSGVVLNGGIYNPLYFAEAQTLSAGKNINTLETKGITATEERTEYKDMQVNFGTSIIYIPLGLRVIKSEESIDSLKLEKSKLTLGFGSYLNFFGFQFGYGFDYIKEEGKEIATSKWIETYLGIGIGKALGVGKFHAEVFLRRRPLVFNYEGDKINHHSKTFTIGINAELKVPLILISSIGGSIINKRESADDYYIDKDIKTLSLDVFIEGPLFFPGLGHGLQLSSSSNDFKHNDDDIGFGYHVSYAL